ncbi:enoyl-CoA hydratase [Tenuibacillus multivorans]|uniref:Enoyl-CoA hydratase/carnithine racemase n=1 Tax=Tenuibacillus multivorans TaxID=237069 RepID=A0A1H0B839_9BACI|nr:enoyl-CoA hydratase [Tenuibacillus multivorans]GEL78607.1 enoyl-CoA hydratase [Tenuibacillus multivorans]SDN41771.1 Enoyl-CoA hydratase/carnithine racemase [Tenuibacillus multivorans]
MGETVQVKQKGPVTTITLNRPDQLNAMDEQLLEELAEILQQVEQDESKIVVLTGAGRAFSAGGDMKTMLQSDDPEGFKRVMEIIKKVSTTFYALPKVTIAAINGAAAGLGLSLALAADYVVAQEDAKIAMNFIGIGLIPDGGGHFYMEQRLGTVKAKQAIWEGQTMMAQEAEAIGLIDVTTDELKEDLEEHLVKLQHLPLQAMIETKRILNYKQLPLLEEVLDLETKGQSKMRQTHDHEEGIQAFLDKREPNFKGK